MAYHLFTGRTPPRSVLVGGIPASEPDATAALVLQGLQWRPRTDCILRYDKETDTIIVDEHGLMRLIMIANPAQRPRALRLGDIHKGN